MSNNEYEAKVRNRAIKFPAVDGLTELELGSIVAMVEERINKIEEKMNIVDSSKLAIIAAYEFAVELHNLKRRAETNMEADTRKIDDMTASLEKALAAAREGDK